MNNSVPNNGNNNEGLNPISLGSVNSNPTQPIENLNNSPVENIDPVPPVEPVQYDVPESINNFNPTPVFNDIGTVPPSNQGEIPPIEQKPKKKQNKLIFVLIIVLLIAAVGVGVYIFLSLSNKPGAVQVIPKDVEIEAGSEVSTNIQDYATFTGVNSANCSLDVSNITDTSVVGAQYAFNITCGANTYNGTAVVVDNEAPVVVLKEVLVQVGGSVSPQDFIDTCTDASECSYAFSDEETVNGYLQSAGNYHVELIARDEAGNEVSVTGTMIVTLDEIPVTPSLYLSCAMNNETINFGIVDNHFASDASRVYAFTFDSINEYNTFKASNENKSQIAYENIVGQPSFDDQTQTLYLTQTLSKAQLDQEEGRSLPTAYGELRAYYVNNGYQCSLQRP